MEGKTKLDPMGNRSWDFFCMWISVSGFVVGFDKFVVSFDREK
jgi:hypothetical protein